MLIHCRPNWWKSHNIFSVPPSFKRLLSYNYSWPAGVILPPLKYNHLVRLILYTVNCTKLPTQSRLNIQLMFRRCEILICSELSWEKKAVVVLNSAQWYKYQNKIINISQKLQTIINPAWHAPAQKCKTNIKKLMELIGAENHTPSKFQTNKQTWVKT